MERKDKGQKLGYIRVYIIEETDTRQVKLLDDMDRIFKDETFANNTDKPNLKALLDYAREGDSIYVTDLAKLGLSLKEVSNLIKELNAKGIHLIAIKEKINTSTEEGLQRFKTLMEALELLRSFNEERQREGIELAKKKGKYKGRPRIELENVSEIINDYKKGTNITMLAKREGVSRTTIRRHLRESNKEVEYGNEKR